MPHVQLAEADIASQARSTAGTLGQTLQSGVANAGTTFNRFVEGSDSHPASSSSSTARTGAAVEPERKDFWESFGAPPKGPSKDKQDFWDEFSSVAESRVGGGMGQTQGVQQRSKPSGIGTSAMKKGKKEDEQWGEW